ncbi:hypothetical protein ANCDUO_23472 [Ancylostoma duodenale]|uniref:Uncharacterized protein n=1 Tax=Ancylostoma duodenale TaxID=51022 RepID=A0A0C2FD70_9BILA|nr:hypothetical protein ANCDUO_23472 [Ancylostoma duodenale]
MTIFVAYSPKSRYDERVIEAFYIDLQKFYREDHTFYKKWGPKPVINWGLFTSLPGFWEDAVVDNIDEEYDRLVQHPRDSAKKAEGSRATKRRLSYEILEVIRHRGAARAAGNYQLTSELAKRCREAIKEDLKERRAAVLAEAVEAGKSIRNARRDFANRKAKMNNPSHAIEGRNTILRQQPKIRDAAAYAKLSRIRCAGHVMRLNNNRLTIAVSDWTPRYVERTTGRPTDPMVRLLHEVLQGKIQCSSCSSNGQNPLDDSGTREGQMEGLLAPDRYIRRSTGVGVIEMKNLPLIME